MDAILTLRNGWSVKYEPKAVSEHSCFALYLLTDSSSENISRKNGRVCLFCVIYSSRYTSSTTLYQSAVSVYYKMHADFNSCTWRNCRTSGILGAFFGGQCATSAFNEMRSKMIFVGTYNTGIMLRMSLHIVPLFDNRWPLRSDNSGRFQNWAIASMRSLYNVSPITGGKRGMKKKKYWKEVLEDRFQTPHPRAPRKVALGLMYKTRECSGNFVCTALNAKNKILHSIFLL